MFIKSASLALVALAAATVSAQTPNHTFFTNPITDDMVYEAGANTTFSWQMACVAPSTATSTTPTKVEVQLVNSTDTNNAFFLETITYIDCSKSSGNPAWVVPDRSGANVLYSLKIVLEPTPVYSGKFKINSKSAPAPSSSAPSAGGSDTTKPSAAGSLVPALTGAVALVASAAAMLF
ncbi:hypothetical protein BC939DRAFT_469408 [Gamsiella multidivaricata]|uniref:uncharacterized protein n=1 Tax=Gamsiella multidivaricata TaxID=101098 RepID=UPI0022201BC9|nr:uncharacterized protein BC939DRAFT_469408 [Gamsiella multidivaricata]KAG0353646.1 hypothetical protein BGZ54_002147 [Gamsiella multidivaricata]KAI7816351.1 hypothetical protein BC939DRAFT_469408 [Gamsiella multidivaricata]